MSKWSRRRFMTAFTSGLLGVGLSGKSQTSPSGSGEELKIRRTNTLGKTGLKVSDVSCGAISFFEPNVLRYAADMGVTYFDTAESYMNQRSETYVGQALSPIRDKVIIATKHGYSPRSDMTKQAIMARMEASLKRMKTDYVDVALCHGLSDPLLLDHPDLLEAYAQLKKDGKVRFTGFSTHDAATTLPQALSRDFVQVVLVIYNHMEGKTIEPLLEQVRKKGIGVVAMKIFAGGKQGNLMSLVGREVSYPQAAIRWVLSNPNVDCCIPTLSSYSHVEEYVAASGQPLDRKDLEVLAEYRKQAGSLYCRVSCSACLSSCPNNVAINDILRYGMYFEDYGMEKAAMGYYAQLEESRRPLSCAGCPGPCQSACPHGLEVRDRLLHARDLLRA